MTTTATSEAVAAAEDLQAFVDRIAYVRCHMAAGEQAMLDKLTGYPYVSTRVPAERDPQWRFENEMMGFREDVLIAASRACGRATPCDACIERAIPVVAEAERVAEAGETTP